MFDVAPAPPSLDPETLKVGGAHHGHLVPAHALSQNTAAVLVLLALLLAVAYGLIFFRRKPSLLKTVVKTGAIAALAASSWLAGGPLLLTLGLALCAVGDAFLAGDPNRWLPFGLASFLAGHLAYLALFVWVIVDTLHQPVLLGHGMGPHFDWPHVAGMAAAALAAAGMLRWLWPTLARLKAAVAAYVVAMVAMVCASIALPGFMLTATVGAIAFFASDAILSAQLFKQRFEGLGGQWAVWGLYFVGQAFITMAFRHGF